MPTLWKALQDAVAPVFRPAGNLIDGVNSGDYASPQNPIRIVAQRGVGVRSWDFTPGINLQFTPRGDQAISFRQLYAVSNSFDLCRLMIETRKDQVVNRPWLLRVRPRVGEKKADRVKREANNPDVGILGAMIRKPDGVHTLDLWVRMWLEQLLVFDAPCIYPVKNVLGSVIMPGPNVAGGFRIIAGQTITPLVDAQGFRPMPPSPAFQQIILGSPTGSLLTATDKEKGQSYKADELIYSPRNPRVDSRWGFSPVEQIIVTLSIASNRQQYLRDYYTSGNVPEGLLPMPESWTQQQIRDFQTWFDSMLAGNLGKRRRMIMIPATEKGAQFSKTEALTDGTDDYLTRVVAFAFSVTPQNLIKQVNRGTAKESTDVAQIEGLEPVLKHIENVMNEVLQTAIPGTEVEFAYQDEREMDPVKQSQVDQIYIDSGAYTRNEIREARGDDPRPEKGADVLTVKSATGVIALDDAITAGEGAAELAGTPPPEPGGGPGGPQGGGKPGAKVRKAQMRLIAGELTTRSRQARQDATRTLKRFLREQSMRVGKQARAAYAKSEKVRKDEANTERDTDRALAILLAIEWQYPELSVAMRPFLETAAVEGAKAGAYQLAANEGVALDELVEAATVKAKAAAASRSAEMAGLKLEDDGSLTEDPAAFQSIAQTAKDDVLAVIEQATAEGWSPSVLEAVIQAATVFSSDHAELIGDHEIVDQQAGGHFAAWAASKVVLEHRWDIEPLACPVCVGFHEQGSVPIGHEFAKGITRPGAHPWCRCWLTATKVKSDDVDTSEADA